MLRPAKHILVRQLSNRGAWSRERIFLLDFALQHFLAFDGANEQISFFNGSNTRGCAGEDVVANLKPEKL